MPVTFEAPTTTARGKSVAAEVTTLRDRKADNLAVDNDSLSTDLITKMRQTKIIDHCAHGTHNLENELHLKGEPIVKSESVKSVNRTLTLQIVLTVVFCAAEFTSGILCSSIAMLADSYHMAADVMALIVAFTCIKIATRVSTRLGYGWVRAETLGGFFNGIFMVTVCLMVFQEGTGRIIHPQLIAHPLTIIIIGFLGLLINAVGIYLLGGHGHSHGGHGHSHGGDHGHSHGKGNNRRKGHGHSHDGGHGYSHDHAKKHTEETNDHNDEKEKSNGKSRSGSHVGKSDALTRLLEEEDSTECMERRLSGITSQNAIIATVDRQMTPYGTHMASEVLNSSTVINRTETKSKKKKDKNVNLHGVWLHLLSDAFGSVIVIVSATVVFFWPNLWVAPYLDPGLRCTNVYFCITIDVFSMCLASIMGFTAVVLVKTSADKLLKKTPEDLDLDQVKSDLCMIAGVSKVEKLSVWTLCGDRIIAAAHVNFCHPAVFSDAAFKIKKYFHDLGVHSTTIEPTFEDKCMQSMKVLVKKILNGKSIEEFTISTEDETIVGSPVDTQ